MRLDIIGRMLLGAAIFRSLRSAPKWLLVCVALAGLAFMSIGTARAQVVGKCGSSAQNDEYNICADQSHALSQCQAAGANTKSQLQLTQKVQCQVQPASNGLRSYYCHVNGYNCFRGAASLPEPTAYFTYRTSQTACPAGTTRNHQTGACDPLVDCAGKPPLVGQSVKGDVGAVCSGGCRYTIRIDGMTVLGVGTPDERKFGVMDPDGATCTGETEMQKYNPDQSVCRTAGSTSSGALTQCVSPNGQQCVISAKGDRLCWNPGETGQRMTQDGSLGADNKPQGQPTTPPPAQQNPQNVSNSTTTINNSTTVTSVFTGSGNSGGQSNTGSGGRDASPGSGSGSGNGDGNGDGDGPGAPGGQPGRFYESNGKGISEAYDAFAQKAHESPLIGAVGNVLGGCSGGGACPVETWDGGDYAGTHSLAEWCSGPLAALLAAAGYVLLAGMGAIALRIGLL